MRQSIKTRYISPTNFHGARVKATSSSRLSLIVRWDDALDVNENHKRATVALCERLNWHGKLAVGTAPKGDGNVYVFVDTDAFEVTPSRCDDCGFAYHTGFCGTKPKRK